MKFIGLSLVATMLTVGCVADAPVIEFVKFNEADIRLAYYPVAGGRDFATVIHGNSTKAPKAQFDTAVISALHRGYRGPTTRFTTTPSDSARPGYRLELRFAPTARSLVGAACAERGQVNTGPAEGHLSMIAAFCYKDEVLAKVRGHTRAVNGPDDPALSALVAQASIALFPVSNPVFGGGGGGGQDR